MTILILANRSVLEHIGLKERGPMKCVLCGIIFHYYSPLCFAFINSLQCNIKYIQTNEWLSFQTYQNNSLCRYDVAYIFYISFIGIHLCKKIFAATKQRALISGCELGIDLCWYLHYYSHFNSKLIYHTNWLITLPSIFDRMISRFSRGFCICNSSDIVVTLLYS